ncbi:porin family protein [Limibacter armeniacum]|uniref:porin family protein n=1 Tax=Limibacter armeniacum TaxID=466084 RepID=UPI002FE4FC89
MTKEMKRLFGLCITLFVVTLSSQGQGVMIGARAGMNLGMMKHSEYEISPDVGFTAGVIFEAATSPIFSLQPELNFAIQRVQVENQAINIQSFEVPLLFKFSTTPRRKVRVFGNIGPAISLIQKISGDGVYYPFTEQFDFSDPEPTWRDYYKSANLSFVIGAGVAFDNILIEGRYYGGLSNLSNSDKPSISVSKFNLTTAYILVF